MQRMALQSPHSPPCQHHLQFQFQWQKNLVTALLALSNVKYIQWKTERTNDTLTLIQEALHSYLQHTSPNQNFGHFTFTSLSPLWAQWDEMVQCWCLCVIEYIFAAKNRQVWYDFESALIIDPSRDLLKEKSTVGRWEATLLNDTRLRLCLALPLTFDMFCFLLVSGSVPQHIGQWVTLNQMWLSKL